MRTLWGSLAVVAVIALLSGIAWATQSDTSTPESAAATCFEHHGFGAVPVDVAKTVDHSEVLAQVGWGANPRGDCYLVLDDQSMSVLREHRAGTLAVPSEEHTVGERLKTGWPSVYECFASGGEDCYEVEYEEDGRPVAYCTPDRSYGGGMIGSPCKVRGTDWSRQDVVVDSIVESTRSYLEADHTRSRFIIFRDELPFIPSILPSIHFICDHRADDWFLVWIRFPGVDIKGQDELKGRVPLVYMFDEVGATVQYEWEPEAEGEHGAHPAERIFPPDPLAFAVSLANSPEFTLTLWNHDNSKIGPVVFDTTGSAREIKRVMEACGIDRYPSPNTL